MLIHFLILKNLAHPPIHRVSAHLIQRPDRSLPEAAISGCGDTTCQESNMWENTEPLFIAVCSVCDNTRRGDIPSLGNIHVNRIYNSPADTHGVLSVLITATKLTRM